jgi:hypothetical protein
MPRKSKKREPVDFSDEDAVLADMAEALDIDPDELTIRDDRSWFSVQAYEVTTRGGRKEWRVVASEDDERELALEIVKQDLEEQPEIFNQDFIEQHIDLDRLRRDLESDVQSSNEERLRDETFEDFWKEAARDGMDEKWTVTWRTANDEGTLRNTFESESDAIDAGENWKKAEATANEDDEDFDESDLDYTVEAAAPEDSDIETLAASLTEEQLKDPMEYLRDIYGDDAAKKAIEIAGIDVDAAAEEAVDTDGAAHFLSSYDGNSYTTPGGLVYWRTN